MAGNNDRRSESSSFKLFSAVHEDDLRARYVNRHAYDLTQCVQKKRKVDRGKQSEGMALKKILVIIAVFRIGMHLMYFSQRQF